MRSLADRFWACVTKSDNCWEWGATILDSGYGQVWAWGKRRRAHRVSWQLVHASPLGDNDLVLHRCDNRKCVRPEHLYVGTHEENMRDRSERDRVHRPKGIAHPSAKLTEDDVRVIRTLPATQRALAEKFGVSQATISLIRQRKHWGHVA